MSIIHYQPPHQHLKERVILVTGAGQGIGKTAALAFAEQGATIILIGRDVSKLENVYDEIENAGFPQAALFPLDLEQAGETNYLNLAAAIFQQLGRLDGILHNAARFDNLSPLAIQTTQQFEKMLQVNLVAPFALTKACLPLLQRAPDASVIFTSTTSAQTPTAYWGAHAISKSAADHMAKIWALELEKFPHIRINTVVPGAIQSPQRKKSHPGELHDSLPTTANLISIYHYLMGPDSAGITGQTFPA